MSRAILAAVSAETLARQADDIERTLADADFLLRRFFARAGRADCAEQASDLIDQIASLLLAAQAEAGQSRTPASPRPRPLREIKAASDSGSTEDGRAVLDPAKLTAAREAAGYDKKTLAKFMGIHAATVSAMERGKFSPAVRLIIRLASACKVEPQSLLVEATNPDVMPVTGSD